MPSSLSSEPRCLSAMKVSSMATEEHVSYHERRGNLLPILVFRDRTNFKDGNKYQNSLEVRQPLIRQACLSRLGNCH
jgi:hypothetical protein